MNRARNANHAAIARERFVYFTVKIPRLYDYQTWQTRFWRNVQRIMGFFLDCGLDLRRNCLPHDFMKKRNNSKI